eukprot:5580806-Lingulodinium_polyedra.AAC.1
MVEVEAVGLAAVAQASEVEAALLCAAGEAIASGRRRFVVDSKPRRGLGQFCGQQVERVSLQAR